CRPWMHIVSRLRLGGFGSVTAADRNGPVAVEFGGLMIEPSLTNVTIVSATRISAAARVQPISSGVLPWIWAATRLLRARKRSTEYRSAPSTRTNTNAAMYRMILYSESISLAFGDPPDLGVKKFASATEG